MAALKNRVKQTPCPAREQRLAEGLVDLEARRSPNFPVLAIGYGGANKPYRWRGKEYRRTEGLAELTNQCRRSCERAVKGLVAKGWLKKRSPIEGRKPGGRGLANEYSLGPELTIPDQEPEQAPAPLPPGKSLSARMLELNPELGPMLQPRPRGRPG